MEIISQQLRVLAALDCLLHSPVGGVSRYVNSILQGLCGEAQFAVKSFTTKSASKFDVAPPNFPGHHVMDVAPLLWRLGLTLAPRMASKHYALPEHDVLWVPVPTTPAPVARNAARILTVHDLAPLARPDLFPLHLSSRWRIYLRSQLALADQIIVPSRFTAAELEQHCGVDRQRISVIPHGTCIDGRASTLPPRSKSDFSVLYLGPLSRKKGSATLLEAFERFLDHRHDARLIIVGNLIDDPGSRIAELLSHSRLKHQVSLRARVTEAELVELYRSCSVVICPSIYEGFGLPILEAMAYGLPVIASRIPPFQEAGGDAARYFDPECPEDLAAQIVWTHDNAEAVVQQVEAGRKHVSSFTWEQSVRSHIEVFRETSMRKRRRG